MPFSQRSASRSLRTLVRGSKVALPEGGDTLRFFLWWKEGSVAGKATGRVDIDLSAVLYDAQWRYKEHISYTNLKSDRYRAYHSGDITSAPNGAAEFIDLDMPSIVRAGGRYVLMSVLSFTRHPFVELPECFAGWMLRSEQYFKAFVASSAMIALLLFSGAIGLYPNLLISTIDTANNLTIDNAASARNTLQVMLVIALIGMPFVLAYTAGVYYFFRGKTELTVESY